MSCDTLSLSWEPPTYQGGSGESLKYYVKVVFSSNNMNYTTINTSYNITGLSYGEMHNISVQAITVNEEQGIPVYIVIPLVIGMNIWHIFQISNIYIFVFFQMFLNQFINYR